MTAYALRISAWSSDVCSSDLRDQLHYPCVHGGPGNRRPLGGEPTRQPSLAARIGAPSTANAAAEAFCGADAGCRVHGRLLLHEECLFQFAPILLACLHQYVPIVWRISTSEHFLEHGIGIRLAPRRPQGLLIIDPGVHDDRSEEHT